MGLFSNILKGATQYKRSAEQDELLRAAVAEGYVAPSEVAKAKLDYAASAADAAGNYDDKLEMSGRYVQRSVADLSHSMDLLAGKASEIAQAARDPAYLAEVAKAAGGAEGLESGKFESYVNRFRGEVGPDQKMSGNGAARMVGHYADPQSGDQITQAYVEVADRLTSVEKAVTALAGLLTQQQKSGDDTRKAMQLLTADYAALRTALKARHGVDWEAEEVADDDGYAGSGEGATEHSDESSEENEKRMSSKRAKKAESISSDEDAESEDTSEEEMEKALRGETVQHKSLAQVMRTITHPAARQPRQTISAPPSMLAKSNGLTEVQLSAAREDVLDSLSSDERAAYYTVQSRINGISGYRSRMSDIEKQLLARVDGEAVELAKARI